MLQQINIKSPNSTVQNFFVQQKSEYLGGQFMKIGQVLWLYW